VALLALTLLAGCAQPPLPPVPTAAEPYVTPPPRGAAGVPVLLIQATSSAPNAAERVYAQKTTARLARWLEDVGIPCRVTDDDALALGGARIAVLACNPQPGSRELAALRRFVERGGRLMVFYSSEPRLAQLLGMRLGAYAAGRPGQWSAFRFNAEAPTGVPPRVEQESRSIRPVYPASAAAHVIAFWENVGGAALPEPAWVRSDRGLWMSHVLLEGDVPAKQQMLLAMLGAFDPMLWQVAADHARRTSGRIGRFRDVPDAVDGITRYAAASNRNTPAPALLAQAEGLYTALQREYAEGRYLRVVQTARQLDTALVEAYARAQAPRPREFRGVWNHSGTGLYPGDWGRTCRILAQNGMTAVLPNVLRPAAALYPSRVVPASETVALCGDQMAQCVAAARRHALQVHAWVICWNLEGAPENMVRGFRRDGRLQVSAAGETLPWLCPSHPANLELELDSIRELVRRYPVDGVQLDYIRYKSADFCFCSGCRQRFSRDLHQRIRRWPADVRTGPLAASYRQWRRDQITRLVTMARTEIRKIRPEVVLSAAVYGSYPGCRDSIAQDWGAWLRSGSVDFVCPMNYQTDTARFGEMFRTQAALTGAPGRILPGIGVTATESRLDAVQTIDQILALRRQNAAGFTLFELNPTLEKEILPYLGMGLTCDATP
jgi:uncharacterized lipoprotein YddW (UPF0748 family)